MRRIRGAAMNEVTPILQAVDQGDAHAADALLPMVYDELRKLAAQRMRGEDVGRRGMAADSGRGLGPLGHDDGDLVPAHSRRRRPEGGVRRESTGCRPAARARR